MKFCQPATRGASARCQATGQTGAETSGAAEGVEPRPAKGSVSGGQGQASVRHPAWGRSSPTPASTPRSGRSAPECASAHCGRRGSGPQGHAFRPDRPATRWGPEAFSTVPCFQASFQDSCGFGGRDPLFELWMHKTWTDPRSGFTELYTFDPPYPRPNPPSSRAVLREWQLRHRGCQFPRSQKSRSSPRCGTT